MTFDSWEQAKEAADLEGMTVCGTFADEHPVYFLMRPESDAGDIEDEAFEIRNHRPFSSAERFYRKLGEQIA